MRTMRSLLRLGLIALTAAAGACVERADVATEERVIRDLDKKFLQAVAAKDTMAIANIYAENAEFLPQGALTPPPRQTLYDGERLTCLQPPAGRPPAPGDHRPPWPSGPETPGTWRAPS